MRSFWRDYIFRPQQYLCVWDLHSWSDWTVLERSTVYPNHHWRCCLRCGYRQYRPIGSLKVEHGTYSESFWHEKLASHLCTIGIHKWDPWVRMVAHWDAHERSICCRCGTDKRRLITT